MGIVVLDFGGQYAHLIANRLRRLNVWAEIRPPDTPVDELRHADGLILSGGPASVFADDRPPFEVSILDSGLPILGLCYGHHLLCQHLGGRVERGDRMEFGGAALRVNSATGVLAGLQASESVWMSHRDLVQGLPEGFEILASTSDCPVAAMGDDRRHIYGLQFHPEVTHTESGMKVFENFIELCGCTRDWTMENFIELETERLRRQTEGRKVFLLVSGGVDSTVAFLLLNRALGEDRVLGLHIDNGFMRKGETALVKRLLNESGFTNLEVVDASTEFLARVEGVAEPELKRRHIGEEFIEVRDRELARLNLDPEEWLLGQGTLYTDTIESGGTDHAEVIKTHHNRVGVIEQLLSEGKVVEPLAQLYKDEVRALGETLGVPHHLVWRHPFPGPGLAVRCLCADGDIIQAASTNGAVDAGQLASIKDQALKGTGLALDVLPLRSVGVQGDGRTYAHPAVLTLGDPAAFYPGEAGAATWDDLERVSTDLTNSTPGINRVLFQLGPQKRMDQRLCEGFLTRNRLDLLREADAIVMDALDGHALMAQVTQMPTVLVPLSSDGQAESIVLRPITTDDFMTARFDRLPTAFLKEVTEAILGLEGVEAVYYDVTHKPPGTVEWE
ncbi:MAG TPA: glutamine-hydrolyzing GMP synthase [Candidatus Latescibacteria bacterium]|nr:glutamine-hydrolyzing GMP synthase [Gemmatimonadaceae bacterium]MDP6017625.1 glutamine-hydrolyzing GMP synthase [Candidatus Latescibacterota bacterium]HJP32540.1 glutamine-hydrolyzing GMP synthase [Candidatus Latescibacterota bacterium]